MCIYIQKKFGQVLALVSHLSHSLRAACCCVLQCVTVCCGVLQCVAVCCSVLQCVAVCCSVSQCFPCLPPPATLCILLPEEDGAAMT